MVKRKGKYINGKLKMERYDMCCNSIVVLKIGCVYKQSKSYPPQVYVEECKCTDPES